MIQHRQQAGFTLVELTLSITFLVVLSLSIIFTSIYVISIYNRGVLLKEVHQVGREITDDLKRSFGSASKNFNPADVSYYRSKTIGGKVSSGRLCTGSYSYLWNTPLGLSEYDNPINNPYVNHFESGGKKLRFIKVVDGDRKYCVATALVPDPYSIKVSDADVRGGSELIKSGGQGLRNLTIHGMITAVKVSDLSTEQLLFNIGFTLGSDNTDFINSTGSCKTPAELGADSGYCAVNNFKITARSKAD